METTIGDSLVTPTAWYGWKCKMAYPRIGASGLDFTVSKWTALADALEGQCTDVIGRCVVSGLELTISSGLSLAISDGVLSSRSWVELTDVEDFICPTNGTYYIWIDEDGVVSSTTTSTYPGGNVVCLGSVTTDGVGITATSTVGRQVLNAPIVTSIMGLMGVRDVSSATYTVTEFDHTILVTPAVGGTTITLPSLTDGQRVLIRDANNNAGTYNITITTTGRLDGSALGSKVIVADNGWVEVVCHGGTDFHTLRGHGVLSSNDLIIPWTQTVGLIPGSNAAAIPASNAAPSFLPFIFHGFEASVDALIFPFGTSAPTSDATTARIRFAFYESNASFLPGTIKYASEDFVLQGGGHVRSTALGYGNVGSVLAAVGICVLSQRRIFKANTLYFIGMHYENTFSSPTTLDGGRGIGHNPMKLSAGTQAWPYTFTNSPTVGAQFSADDELRPAIAFRYRRIERS